MTTCMNPMRTRGREFVVSTGRRCPTWLKALAALWLLLLCGPAFASLSCSTGYGALNFSLPSGTYAIPRDAPVGTLIAPFTNFQTNYPNVWICSETTTVYVGPVYQSLRPSANMSYSDGSGTYQVFNTNLAGVGIVMKIGSWLPSLYNTGGSWYGQGGLNTTGWQSWGAYSRTPAGFDNFYFGAGMAFGFVKTGPITPGTVSLAGPIAQIGMSERPIASVSNILPVTVTGNPVFTVLACTTPNVNVSLGTHRSSEFGGPNTFTAAVNFNVALNYCPAGLNSIKYQIDAATPVVNAANSVVALDGTSTATGVGVQLLDGSGNVFPLGSAKSFGGYNSTTGGSYTIPFQARYYQTGTAVGPGTANSAMTFTMTYQ